MNYSKTFSANDSSLPIALDFINEIIEGANIPPKAVMQIDVAFEELFVNVAHYAYGEKVGDVTIDVETNNDQICITLKDSGAPFDPLAKPDPDINAPLEERQIGGLGIFMVKKTMDGVSYEYIDNMNCTTIKKNI